MRKFKYRHIEVTVLAGRVEGNIADFSKQFNITWLAESQSIPKITSNPDKGRHIRSTIKGLFRLERTLGTNLTSPN